jgi:DNA-binding NtrC family response regulator
MTEPLPALDATGGRISSLRVTVIEGPDEGLVQFVAGDRLTIGRGEGASVRMRDTTVSQFHVELSALPGGLQAVDCGSRNGVRAGGVRIERGVIPYGVPITLGHTVLRVDPAGGDGAPAAPIAGFGGLVGEAPAMRALYAALAHVAGTDGSLLIEGGPGTGKGVAARAVHRAGKRADRPFVVLDCGAVPPSLAAAILCGHERGAIPGASEGHMGVFEAAQGGTLLLDEVDELPLEVQALLLQVLREGGVVSVGGGAPRPVDVRVISTTRRDLRGMVNHGTFREDLYCLLAQTTAILPPLSARQEDIGALAQHFLAQVHGQVKARGISEAALRSLSARPMPGNVRELRDTVQRLAMIAEEEVVTESDVVFERMLAVARSRGAEGEAPQQIEPFKSAKRTIIDDFERRYMERLMERTNNNLSHAAALAGLERHNLRDILKKHGIYRPAEPRPSNDGE